VTSLLTRIGLENGAERKKWYAGVKKMTGARAVGRGAWNRAGSGSHRNRCERKREILPLLLWSIVAMQDNDAKNEQII